MDRTLLSLFAVVRARGRHAGAAGGLAVVVLGAVGLAGMHAARAAAEPPSNRVFGNAQFGPETSGVQGWRSKAPDKATARVGVTAATAADLPARVTGLLGYDPFVLKTAAGSLTLDRGMQFTAAGARAAVAPGAPVVCTVMTSVPAQPAVEALLTNSGCEVIRPLSVNSYAVRADLRTLQEVAADPLVYWVGQMPWELKVDPLLAKSSNVPGATQAKADPTNLIEPGKAVVALYDAADAADVAAAVEAAGGTVVRVRYGGDSLVCAGLGADAIRAIAGLAEVAYVDGSRVVRAAVQTSMALSGAQDVVGNDASTRYGSRIPVGLIDTGLQRDHDAFRAHGTVPALVAVGSSSTDVPVDILQDNPSGHGTAVSSVILSRWIPQPLLGAAPWAAGGGSSFYRYVRAGADLAPPDDLLLFGVEIGMNALFTENQVEVINNSWGQTSASGMNPGTDQLSVLLDNLTWARRQIWVFSAGNSGPGAGSIDIPAGAKNAIAVGSVLDAAALTLSSFSSEGPTQDLRKKPDIYAPGENITMALASDPKGTTIASGTSFAAPHVTGFLATLVDHFPQVKRRPQLAKAMMMAAATPGATLQPHTGVLNSYETHFATPSSVLVGLFTPGDVPASSAGVFWDLNGIPPGLSGLYVVLTWIEPPAVVGAPAAVINDIDLLVDVGKEGFVDFQSRSSVDNVETLFIPTPPSGNYRFIANKFTASTSYAPALAVFAFTAGANRVPTTPRIDWLTPPPPSARGREPLNLSWQLSNFVGPITQNQVHVGRTSVLKSSPAQGASNGTHVLTMEAPNIGAFDSPTTFRHVVGALDGATQILSPVTATEVEAGPLLPLVEWVVPPPSTVASGGSFTVQWRLRNYVDPATQNSVVWGVTSVVAQSANQPGGNGTFSALVTAPVVGTPGSLTYTAVASNGIEFAFAPLRLVQITP